MKKLAVILLLLAACSSFPLQVKKKQEYYSASRFEGTIVAECAAVQNGCQFEIAVPGERNVRDVYVPWGTTLMYQVKVIPIYSRVRIEAVDRGDGMFVLRSIKEYK